MTTTARPRIDIEAERITDALLAGRLPRTEWDHRAHLLAGITLVRSHGAGTALSTLREAIRSYNELTGTANTATSGYHETVTVFYVWAIDRLLTAGLTTTEVLWHPLVSPGAPRSWWDARTLWSSAAREHFVPATLALPGDPVPVPPVELALAS